jgi:tetratricopeptide (TPR) repeat protein
VAGIAVPSSINARWQAEQAKTEMEKAKKRQDELAVKSDALNTSLVAIQGKEKAAQEKANQALVQYRKAQEQTKVAQGQASQASQKSLLAQQQFVAAQQQVAQANVALEQVNQEKQVVTEAKAQAEQQLAIAKTESEKATKEVAIANKSVDEAKIALTDAQKAQRAAFADVKYAQNDLQILKSRSKKFVDSSAGIVNGYLINTTINQNLDEWIDFYSNFLELNPESSGSAPALWGRGVSYYYKGNNLADEKDVAAATKYYEMAIIDLSKGSQYSSYKSDWQSHYWSIAHRGVVHRKLKKHQKSLDDLTIVINALGGRMENEPRWAAAWSLQHRADTYAEMGNYKNAIADAQKVIDIQYDDKTRVQAYMKIAGWWVELSKESPNKTIQNQNIGYAIDAYHQVIKISPDKMDALSWLGYYYTIQGKKELALDYINRIIRLDPTNKWALQVRDGIQK